MPQPMVEKTVKSALPIYFAAASFVLCLAVPQTFTLTSLVVGIAAAAAVYFAANKLIPPKKIMVPAPPTEFATGDAALNEQLRKAQADLAALQVLNDRIPDEALSASIARMHRAGTAILQKIASMPQSANSIRRFLAYYLPMAVKILTTYADTAAAGVQGENVRKMQESVLQNAALIADVFEKQLDALYRSEMLDVGTDLSVLEAIAKADGLDTATLHVAQPQTAPSLQL